MKKRLEIEALRVISIAYLAFHHSDDDTGNIFGSKIDWVFTWVALSAFVFISGYLLSRKYKIESLKDASFFFKKRFLRLGPLTLFFVTIIMLFNFKKHEFSFWIMQTLIGVNIFLGGYFIYYWFISLILTCYLFYMVLTYQYSFKKFFILGCLLLVCLANLPVNSALNSYTPIFIIGIVAGKHEKFYETYIGLWKVEAVSFLCLVIYFLSINNSVEIMNYVIRILICILPLPALLVFSGIIVKNIYVAKAVSFGGSAALVVYLVHFMVFDLLYKFVYFLEPIIATFIVFTIGLPISFFIGHYIQSYYDHIMVKIIDSKDLH